MNLRNEQIRGPFPAMPLSHSAHLTGRCVGNPQPPPPQNEGVSVNVNQNNTLGVLSKRRCLILINNIVLCMLLVIPEQGPIHPLRDHFEMNGNN